MAAFGLKKGIVVMRLDHEGIVVDTNTGRYLAINRTAFEMIDALTVRETEAEALDRLLDVMDVDRPTLERDLAVLKGELQRLELAA